MTTLPSFTPFRALETLSRHGVAFLVIGAVAAIAQGYPLTTQELDITPAPDAHNLERLAAALDELNARLRSPSGEPVPFPIEAKLLAQAAVWTLTTDAGPLDIVFLPAGTSGYEDLRRDALELDLQGVSVLVASLADVIRSKEAANRPKDQAQLPALRQTLELVRERERQARLG